ncbi:MAG: DNA-binding protein [Methanotrichaceae archaeon]|nr:DNA-binding protein [Methanotrichaceae archaeon]
MKRSKYEIVSQILNICKGGANKTRIVYQVNLNFKTVNPYLDLLVKNDLISSKQNTTIVYETTDKGLDLLDSYERVQNQINDI